MLVLYGLVLNLGYISTEQRDHGEGNTERETVRGDPTAQGRTRTKEGENQKDAVLQGSRG